MTINQKISSIVFSINYLISDGDEVIILIKNIFDLNIILFNKRLDDNEKNDTNSKIEKMRKVL